MTDHSDKEADCPCRGDYSSDKFLTRCYYIIGISVRLLALLMIFVILWGTLDVVWVLYQRMSHNPFFLLNINDILATFGAFIAVLIAIEIFENIVMYLERQFIQIRLVVATGLMAAARKVIILDFKEIPPDYIWAISGVILALGVTYWLLTVQPGKSVALEGVPLAKKNIVL